MSLFWKATAAVLIGLILILTMGKQEKDMGLLLNIAVCCMTATALLQVLDPVLAFLRSLGDMTDLGSDTLNIMFKLTGIGLICELVSLICSDAGYASLGKGLQLLGCGVMLYLSVPVMEHLLRTISAMMGGL